MSRVINWLFKADALGLDSGDYQDRPTVFFKAELVGIAALAITVVILPLGPQRFFISALLVSFMATQVVLRNRLSPVYSDGVQIWLGAFVALICCSILPVLHAAGVVAIAGLVVSGAREMGRAAYAILAISTLWLVALYFAYDPPSGHLPILALLFTAPTYVEYSIWAAGQYRLRRQRENMLLQSGRAVGWEYDLEKNCLVSITGPTQDLLGYSEAETLNRLNAIPGQFGEGRPVPGREWTIKQIHADGSSRWFRVSAIERTRADGLVVAYGVAIDITDVELGRLSERQRANRDPLTGLPNRNGFAKFLNDAVHSVGRAVLVIDLDRFKDVNDTLGHLVGDRLIAAVAQRLSELSNEGVCVARLGGDEFAIAVVTNDEETVEVEAEQVANEINRTLEGSFALGGVELTTTASVGIASGANLDWAELLRRADGAMYNAKRGRHPFRWYDSSEDAGSFDRVRQRNELERHLEAQIVLHYQPIIGTVGRQLEAVEALARWEHPKRGLLSPGEFLPLIESSDNAIRFDRHIMTMAVCTAAELAAIDDGPMLTANLRPASLKSQTLVTELRALLNEYPLAAGRLILEITEEGLADDPERLLPSLHALKEMGVRLAIDDFGTGASSLIRLRSLPFDLVKVDRSFVSGVPNNEVDTTIVRSTIALARDLGMTTVAEGVETAETADALTELGCDKLQGWLFDKALPLDELIDKYDLNKSATHSTAVNGSAVNDTAANDGATLPEAA